MSFLNNGGRYASAAPHPTARLVRLSEAVWVDPVDVAAVTESHLHRVYSVRVYLWSGQDFVVENLRADDVAAILTGTAVS